jgi:ATP-dependent exoDNAse (exonuclease V) alpha subunit
LLGHPHLQHASVRLVGDDQQLAAIGAGGVFRDIAPA